MNEIRECIPCRGAEGSAEMCVEPQNIRPVTAPVLRCINIEPLNRGFIVRVGCQSLAVSTIEELVKLFNAYMENPEKVEKEWMREGKLPE